MTTLELDASLGLVPRGVGTLARTVELQNSLPHPVAVTRWISSCGCLQVDGGLGEFPPGATFSLRVLLAVGEASSAVSVVIQGIDDRAGRLSALVRLTGSVDTPLTIVPREVALWEEKEDQVHRARFTVVLQGQAPAPRIDREHFTELALVSRGVTPIGPGVAVERTTETYELMSHAPSAPMGPRVHLIRLHYQLADGPIDAQFRLIVVRPDLPDVWPALLLGREVAPQLPALVRRPGTAVFDSVVLDSPGSSASAERLDLPTPGGPGPGTFLLLTGRTADK